MKRRSTHHGSRGQHGPWTIRSSAGFTLIELMVAMLLGLIVVAGVVSVFLANQRSYRTNEALSDVQDSSRIAFEMMARDIRHAGLTGCSNNGRVANVLNNRSTKWWANWGNALVGYGGGQTDPAAAIGTGAGQRVSGTDSLMLLGAESSGVSVKSDAEPAATFTINETSSNLQTGDVIIVCDPDHAAIAQITGYGGGTIMHAASGSPGNCTTDLNYPTVCSSGSSYVFAPNAQIAKLAAADWYVGNFVDKSGVKGQSLYRVDATESAQEMVRNVTNMSIAYHQAGNAGFVPADDAQLTNWALVDAVQVTLTVESTDKRASTDVKPITRTFTATTTVRNRVK